MAVCSTYSKGPSCSLERFSGFVEGRISIFVRPIYDFQLLVSGIGMG